MDRLNIYLYMNTDPLLTLVCALALALSCAYTCGAYAEISWTKANAEDREHTCAVLPASTCSSLRRDWKCYGHIFFQVNTEMTIG